MKTGSTAGRLLTQLTALALFALTPPAFAQQNNVRLVHGFAPGGPVDAVARIINVELGKQLGANVVVEPRPGANAGIAADHVAKSAPDGRTLFLTSTGAVAINPILYPKLGYDPVRDFAPVSLVISTAEVLIVPANHPANDVKEFVAHVKKQPNGATLGSSGSGSIPHLAAELFVEAAGIKMVHVPYKGIAPAITDTMAGHIDGVFVDVPIAVGHIKAGKVKALGLAAPERHPTLPDTKTFSEMGVKGVDSDNWYAIFAPKGTPAAEIKRLNEAVHRTLATPSVKSQLLALGARVAPGTPADLAQLLKSDMEKWGRVIREKKIVAN